MIDLRDPGADPALVIEALGLAPHPEGGHYRETWRDAGGDGARGAGTAILFLLRDGEASHWHRVDAAELWIWQAGAPLRLRRPPGPDVMIGPNLSGPNLSAPNLGGPNLGAPNLGDGELPHAVVPAGTWQAARSAGAWTLCCCVVAPAFRFDGFELAPAGWEPDFVDMGGSDQGSPG
jgi:predicted cupin superfamily sugar epimerase